MANERTYPCLPCRDKDESVAFYASLGFERTYRQVRPNPYAVVAREDIHIHRFSFEGFDPANSYGTVIVGRARPRRALSRLRRRLAPGAREAAGRRDPADHSPAQEVRDRPRL